MAISIIRTLILYTVMVTSMRVMGKRQLGELEPAELVVAILISDLAANPLQDLGTPLAYGLVPVMTLLFCEVMLSAVVLKSRRVRRAVSGTPSVIIENGALDRAEMKRNRYTIDELSEHLRKNGVPDISTVKHATLEKDGTLSTVLYAAEAPAIPKQMNLAVPEPEIPLVVISDGEVIGDSLKKLGFDEKWLSKRLSENGNAGVDEVFLMTADKSGKIYIAPKEQK
ncbi:MAG: DUF421 domain-containing protein [Oscillospiraceae bacterium]|nr:DUF421 domain-containing protein [Oscillospiraceae bacterium]